MGMSLDVYLGYGLILPVDDNKEDFSQVLSVLDDPNGWGKEDALDSYLRTFQTLSYVLGRYGDYPIGGAIFVNRLTSRGYAEAATLPTNLSLTFDEHEELRRVAVRLGIDNDPQIIAIPAYW